MERWQADVTKIAEELGKYYPEKMTEDQQVRFVNLVLRLQLEGNKIGNGR